MVHGYHLADVVGGSRCSVQRLGAQSNLDVELRLRLISAELDNAVLLKIPRL